MKLWWKGRESLDEKQRKRLEELENQWEHGELGMRLMLSAGDLRLMLEHSERLRALIREISAPEASSSALPPTPQGCPRCAEEAQKFKDLEAKWHQTSEDLEQAHGEIATLRDDLRQKENRLQEMAAQIAQLRSDLRQKEDELLRRTIERDEAREEWRAARAEVQKLQQTKMDLEQDNLRLHSQLQEAKRQLARLDAPRDLLAFIHREPELARLLELDVTQEDIDAFIQVVAVLSQRDNLLRLWEVIKDRCEQENRAASAEERRLLDAALTWHNFNWRTQPYRLVELTPPCLYRHERHLRSRNSPAGEKVRELRLPGVADGRGDLVRKPLVYTHT